MSVTCVQGPAVQNGQQVTRTKKCAYYCTYYVPGTSIYYAVVRVYRDRASKEPA